MHPNIDPLYEMTFDRTPLEMLNSVYNHLNRAHPWRSDQRYSETPQAVVWTVARRMVGR